jgi:hypothetical protein
MSGLLPTQRRWVDVGFVDWHHFNLGLLCTVPPDLTDDRLTRAVQRVLDRNPALRTAYAQDGAGGWHVSERPVTADAVIRPAELSDYQGKSDVLNDEIMRLQRTLRPDRGEVFRVVHFPWGSGEPGRLLITVHHLTLDGFSLGLVTGELDRALRDEPQGPLSATPADYVGAVEKWVGTDQAARDAGRWAAMRWDRVAGPPTDLDEDATLPTMRIDSVRLDADPSTALTAACRAHRLRPGDVLLDAVAQTIMSRWDLAAVAVDTYHIGRHLTPLDIDVLDTIGYVQSTFPIVLSARPHFDPADIREVPDRMFGFDALTYFTERLDGLPATTVRYNFRGHMGRLTRNPGTFLRWADEPVRQRRSQRQGEKYTLMLEGDIVDGRFELSIKYSTGQYRVDTISALLAGALTRVEATIGELGC